MGALATKMEERYIKWRRHQNLEGAIFRGRPHIKRNAHNKRSANHIETPPNLEEGAIFWAHVFTIFWRALNLVISTIFRGAPKWAYSIFIQNLKAHLMVDFKSKT